ncbi:MAG: cation diffusion facilitator family transporter [Bacteroidota bacterium]
MHKHSQEEKGQRGLLISTVLNFVITAAQVVGGLMSNSLALMSDALHNFGDAVAVFVAWLAGRIGKRDANERKTFGYKRIEIIAAFVNAAVLVVISVVLFVEAAQRFVDPEPVKGPLMLIVAGIGLLANLVSVFILNPHKGRNINIKAAYLHLMGDTLSSVAVIFGGIAIVVWEMYWIDPVITVGVGLYIIFHTVKILRHSFDILMQSTPAGLNLEAVSASIEAHDEICNVHHMHAWTLDDDRLFLECHIQLCSDMAVSDTEHITNLLSERLKNEFNITHLTVQYEYSECPDESVKHS